MDKPAVCIINYNTSDLLRACLQSVLSENPAEVIVFDNASTDGSAVMAAEEFPTVKVIAGKENIGYGAASNLAISGCAAEHIILLNGDTRLKPGFLAAAGAYLAAHSSVGIMGPQIRNLDGAPQTSRFHFPTLPHIFLYLSGLYRLAPVLPVFGNRSLQAAVARPAQAVPWVLGAAIALRKAAFQAAGGFDEKFFLYFEETDLCYRLAKMGWQTHFNPEAEVIHTGGASTSQRPVESSLQYFSSLALFYRKYYSPAAFTLLASLVGLFACIRLCRDVVRMQFTSDFHQREALIKNISTWQGLLLDPWSRQPDQIRGGI